MEDVQICSADQDCTDNPFQTCHFKDDTSHGICSHKGIFPMTSVEGWGLVVFTSLMALSNIGGTGGGSIAVPILMAFFHFNTKPAIAISSVPIIMASAIRFLIDFKERHPEKRHSTLIDYNLMAIMMPTTLAGS